MEQLTPPAIPLPALRLNKWMVVKELPRDRTTIVRASTPNGDVRIEVQAITEKEQQLNDVPPFIAICGNISGLKPLTAPGHTLDAAVNELLYRLDQRAKGTPVVRETI